VKQNANLFYILFCIVLLTSSNNLWAQDSIRKHPLTYTNAWDFDRNTAQQLLDTNMNETEIFHPMYQKNVLFQDLGNIGTAGRSAIFSVHQPVGFNGVFNPYSTYFFAPQNTRFYNTTKPFTELFYTQGSQELLFLKATHTQNILPRWNVGVDFQRISSEGFLLRQKTSHYNTQITTNYHSKDKRYYLLAAFTWNKGTLQENGGIVSDSSFEALSGSNKTVNVNLNFSQNQYRNRSAWVKQYYRFGTSNTVIQGDDTLYGFDPKSQISHTIKAEETSHIFINSGDSNLVLLPNQFYSTTPYQTYDSLYNGLLENKINYSWLNTPNKLSGTFLNVGISHQAAVVSQSTYTRNHQNLIAEAQFEKRNKGYNTLSFFADASIVLWGFNQNNHLLKAGLSYHTKPFELSVSAAQQQYTPDYAMLKFASNQFVWDNNFDISGSLSQHVVLKTNAFKNNFTLSFNHYLISKHTYLNQNLLPEQASGDASVIHVQLDKTFKVWKFFFKHTLHYQQSNAKYIPVPEFGGMLRYYFETNFYTSKIQLGVDVFYNTAYYGMGWSPATRMFYVQQQNKIGNYPLVNPFISMQIKRAVLFGIFEHANQNLVNKGFYNTPHYPVSLQSFRMGVRWRLYN
jgi:hypothetical protein